MTKKTTYFLTISGILLLIIITTVGATYAYYSMAVSGNNNVQANSEKYEIIYQGGEHITGEIPVTANKDGGKNTMVQIGLGQGSAAASANIYIKIESITNNLAIAGFKWEVYRINGANEIYVNSGDFSGYKTGDQIPIVNNYQLSETITKFKIYIWIDGNNSDSSINGGSFDGYVGANTDILTGIVKTN